MTSSGRASSRTSESGTERLRRQSRNTDIGRVNLLFTLACIIRQSETCSGRGHSTRIKDPLSMVKKVILILLLSLVAAPLHVRAGDTGTTEASTPARQPSGSGLPDNVDSAEKQQSGQSKVVIEIPRSQWCQCVRAILDVEGGNIAGCVKSGASEEKLKIFRSREKGSGSLTPVSALLSIAGCSESETE